jgi:class 3 adenylate cyclase
MAWMAMLEGIAMRMSELKWSETRLWELIEQRTRPDADVEAIDRRIWDLFGETWAVMFTDLAGFSRQVDKFGIIHFLGVIQRQKELLLPVVANHDGILIKIEADSLLCIYRRCDSAYRAAQAMHKVCVDYNADKTPEEQVLLCLGLGFGKMLRIGDIDVYGREVNAASKLGEDIAKQGEILATEAFCREIEEHFTFQREALSTVVPGSRHNYRIVT